MAIHVGLHPGKLTFWTYKSAKGNPKTNRKTHPPSWLWVPAVNTVDGRNPKQPPEMYKTPIKNWDKLTTFSSTGFHAGFLVAINSIPVDLLGCARKIDQWLGSVGDFTPRNTPFISRLLNNPIDPFTIGSIHFRRFGTSKLPEFKSSSTLTPRQRDLQLLVTDWCRPLIMKMWYRVSRSPWEGRKIGEVWGVMKWIKRDPGFLCVFFWEENSRHC